MSKKLEHEAFKEQAYKDAKKHVPDDYNVFDTPNIVGDPVKRVYSNKYYAVFICERYGYAEILDKEKYRLARYGTARLEKGEM